MMSHAAAAFKPNSYVRDAVVNDGSRMGFSGGAGFIGRALGGVVARNGVGLTGESISSIASRDVGASCTIGGDIADRSLGNYMPHLAGHNLSNSMISGGHISTTVTGADGKTSEVEMYSASQFEHPTVPHSTVTASDGSEWFQMASGSGMGEFYDAPNFTGSAAEADAVAAAFPDAAEGTSLRTVGEGVLEAATDQGSTLWYNSAFFEEPDAPHTIMQSADGVDWYAMQQQAEAPQFEEGAASFAYNQAAFQNFMPGFDPNVTQVDGAHREDGHFAVMHEDGSGTAFYDTARYNAPRGDYQVYEDVQGNQWYAIHGDAAVERRPIYENGRPVQDENGLRTVNEATVRYRQTPSRYSNPTARTTLERKTPRRKK